VLRDHVAARPVSSAPGVTYPAPTPSTTTVTSPRSKRAAAPRWRRLPDEPARRVPRAWPGRATIHTRTDTLPSPSGPAPASRRAMPVAHRADLENARDLERSDAHHLDDDGVAHGERWGSAEGSWPLRTFIGSLHLPLGWRNWPGTRPRSGPECAPGPPWRRHPARTRSSPLCRAVGDQDHALHPRSGEAPTSRSRRVPGCAAPGFMNR